MCSTLNSFSGACKHQRNALTSLQCLISKQRIDERHEAAKQTPLLTSSPSTFLYNIYIIYNIISYSGVARLFIYYQRGHALDAEFMRHVTCDDNCFNLIGSARIPAEPTEAWPESPDPSFSFPSPSVRPLIIEFRYV